MAAHIFDATTLVSIGLVKRTHGVRGRLDVALDGGALVGDDAEWAFLYIDGLPVPFRIDDLSIKGRDHMLLKLEGIDSEQQAKRLAGSRLAVLAADLDATAAEGGDALIGYSVCGVEEGYVGRITAVDTRSANTLLSVEAPDGREILLPLSEDLIAGLDEAARTLTLSLPDGILTLND